MKKLCLSILASLALTLGLVSQVQADEYLRIGMEALEAIVKANGYTVSYRTENGCR